MNQEKKDKLKKKAKEVLKEIISFAMTFAVTSALCKVTFTYALEKNKVSGPSMEPTLHNNDRIISTRIFSIDPGDIVTIDSSKLGEMIVKRVIAVAGQEVDIAFDEYPVTVPEGYIFVMGDNRNISLDSKNKMLGLVPVEEVHGQVIMKNYPFTDIKFFQ